jgi:hypothetical protein
MSSSASSSNNINGPSASRGSNGPSRGVPPSPIFPNVITGPGSPPGHQPPVTNTIVQAFSKQRTAKEKKTHKAELLADTRRRIISFLAAPTAFHDPSRILSIEQLAGLTDEDLMENAFNIFTTENVAGSLRLSDGSSISMLQCINEFANYSLTRDGASIRRRLKEKLNTLRAIAEVERYSAIHEDDDIDPFLEDNLSEDGILDFGDEQSSSIKRKLHTTLAGATVGKKQVRHADKRQHKPTNRFGDNVAVKDRHVIYATESRSLQRNRQLLMFPGTKSASLPNSVASVFPELIPIESSVPVGSTSANGASASIPEFEDSKLPNVVEVASSMSAPPFAAGCEGTEDGPDDVDNIYSDSKVSDYGSDANRSGSSSVRSDYDDDDVNDAPADYNTNFEWYDGHHSDLFETLFRTVPAAGNTYRPSGTAINGLFGPLVFSPPVYPPAMPALLPHVDDGMFLDLQFQESTFEQRTQLLYLNWTVLHAVDTLHDIKKWLESLTKDDHLLLIHLHAAYWVTAPVTTLSFGSTKTNLWNAINHGGKFVNGMFVIIPDVPLVSVTVECLLVRTVGQWVQFLSRHHLSTADIWDVSPDNALSFAALDATVHPRYDILIAALIDMVNYCSDAYRNIWSIEFLLQRQMTTLEPTRLNLNAVDANTLLSVYFPTLYDVTDQCVLDGLHLLRRARTFVLSSPTSLQFMSECNARWIHLLACIFLPLTVNVVNMSNEEKVEALVQQRPPSFTNDTLRTTYPSLLQQPNYILKEFLNSNSMALSLYGTVVSSDTYGMLRLKLMGCLVAIIQDFYAVENVDSVLSRSDIYYIAHVGGILVSSQRQFRSNIFVVFDSATVISQLAQLFEHPMSILISPSPHQPHRLSSAEGWSKNFASKLKTDAAKEQAHETLKISINSEIVDFPLFGTVRPHFVRLSRRDRAMLHPAEPSDYVRQLASSVRAQYNRMRVPLRTTASRHEPVSATGQSSSALVNLSYFGQIIAPDALFGPITAEYDEWNEYIEPVAYSVQEQQRISNWNSIRNLRLSGNGLAYMQCLRLYNTSERPIALSDKMVFLHCPNCVFTPEAPSRTLFLSTHVLYAVVNIRESIFYWDRVEVLCNYVAMEPMFSKIASPYVGTYILFIPVHDSGELLPTVPSSSHSHQQQSGSDQQSSRQLQVRPGSVQQRPSTGATASAPFPAPGAGSHRTSASDGHGTLRVESNDHSFAQPVDYDSDDSQVKKKTKVAALDFNGQTFYVTGKESALHILRDTYSVRSLMEHGQLQLLVHHVGDFVNNYTADVFKMGIIRRHSKSALLAGMNLTMHGNHDLDRLQSLAYFNIKEMQENLYFQKYSFPDAQTTFSLCAEHYLTKADADACGFHIVTYDFWVRSWKGYQLVLKLLLGASYGIVIKEIIDEILQDNIGQYNDVSYLLSLTATMRALLYEYSSSIEDFTLDFDTTVYTPANMTKAQWLVVIRLLWSSFKEKLSYNRQTEYQHARSLYPSVRYKPYSGKVVPATGVSKAPTVAARVAVAVTPVRTKHGNNKKSTKSPPPSRPPSPSPSKNKKVEFGVAICISDLAKKYKITTNLEACKPDCPFMHYDQLPPNLTAESVISKVKKILGRLNLTTGQTQYFFRQIEKDSKFK